MTVYVGEPTMSEKVGLDLCTRYISGPLSLSLSLSPSAPSERMAEPGRCVPTLLGSVGSLAACHALRLAACFSSTCTKFYGLGDLYASSLNIRSGTQSGTRRTL